MDKRIDQLAATSPANTDQMPIWDVSQSGTKKITLAQLASFIGASAPGTTQSAYIDGATGATVNDPTLIGKSVLTVFRGSQRSGKIITTGTPTGEQILFDTSTGDLTAANPFIGEDLLILYT